MSPFKTEEMIFGLRETVAEIEPGLSRKRTLCCKHGVLLNRIILGIGARRNGVTPDMLMAVLE